MIGSNVKKYLLDRYKNNKNDDADDGDDANGDTNDGIDIHDGDIEDDDT